MNPYPPPPSWASELVSVGVTGTNGKSSTTRFVAAGASVGSPGPVGRVTTVDAAVGDEVGPPPPDHRGFLALMQTLRERGGQRVAIEATSAALGLGFARAWPFRVGVFTNLGHDHQRTHGSFEHYLASKAQLFLTLEHGGAAVLNAGDPASSLIAEVLPTQVRALWFAGPGAALDRSVDLRVRRATPSWSGLTLELEADPKLGPIPSSLRLRTLPIFQAQNAAAALLACVALGVPGVEAAHAIAKCEAPRGRFEVIHCNHHGDHDQAGPESRSRPRVIVDYAHTPEALTAALTSARSLCPGRVVLVLGAGGDADASKRGPLGAAASAADLVWLTSDNPRNEDPQTIVDALARGLEETEHHVELDRRRAVSAAIHGARGGDLVLIAGKGHEQTQEISGERLPLCDHELARTALRSGT